MRERGCQHTIDYEFKIIINATMIILVKESSQRCILAIIAGHERKVGKVVWKKKVEALAIEDKFFISICARIILAYMSHDYTMLILIGAKGFFLMKSMDPATFDRYLVKRREEREGLTSGDKEESYCVRRYV